MKETIISLKGLTKEYPAGGGEKTAVLKGIDLDIYKNEMLVILGESGSGKTTLLNIIGGLDNADGGTVMVEGQDFSHPSEKELTAYRREKIGFVFQDYNLMPNLTAIENVRLIADLCKNSGDPKEAIRLVGLSDKADNYPSALSGGQQQRVSIARAIVKKSGILLADEPTAALDFSTGIEILSLIEKLIAEEHLTVIMVTHNAEIAKMADRIIKIKNGRIAEIKENNEKMTAARLSW